MPDGIAYQVFHHLDQSAFITQNQRQTFLCFDRQIETLFAGTQFKQFKGAFQQLVWVDRLQVERQGAGIRLAEQAQVADHTVEPRDFRIQHCQSFGCRFKIAIAHRLNVPPNHGQRSSQIVSDIGCHAFPLAVALFNFCAHLVECLA